VAQAAAAAVEEEETAAAAMTSASGAADPMELGLASDDESEGGCGGRARQREVGGSVAQSYIHSTERSWREKEALLKTRAHRRRERDGSTCVTRG
jgi:hypothetical protein